MAGAVVAAAGALAGGIAVAGAVALRRGNVSAAVNAALAFLVALLPIAVGYGPLSWVAPGVAAVPELALWTAGAGLLHVVGMLGWYESVAWWDHLTHGVSSALATALVYAGLLVVGGDPAPPRFRPRVAAAGAVALVLAAGVWWELLELAARDVAERLDVEPVLVYYGRRDTALDLVFDAVGALAVVLADVRTFVPVAAGSPSATRTALVAVVAVVVVGSVLLGAGLALGRPPDRGTPPAE